MSREEKKAAPSPWRSPMGPREERDLGSSAEILERGGISLAVSKNHVWDKAHRPTWRAYLNLRGMTPKKVSESDRHREALLYAYTRLRDAAFEFWRHLRWYDREHGERATKTYWKTTVVLEVYTKDQLPEDATLESVLAAANESDAVLLAAEWDWYEVPADWVYEEANKQWANFKEFDPDYVDEEEE